MIICLEGVDGAGKSTLAAAIKKELTEKYPDDTVEYLHASQLTTSVYEAYYEPLKSYIPGSGHHLILDRWHLGEEIYGPLYREKSAFTLDSFRWIEMFLGSNGARLWNVTQPLEVLQERLKERGEDFLQEEHISKVRIEFIEKSKESSLYAGSISPTLENVYELAEHIILDAAWGEMRARAIYDAGLTSYIGHTYSDPRTILVVDNKAVNRNFRPDQSEESRIILSSLRREFAKDFAVVTSISQDKLKAFLSELYVTGIIAYNEAVSNRLNHAGIKHVKFDEPDANDRGYIAKISIAAAEAGK